MPDAGSKRNRSSANLLLFSDFKQVSHQNSQIHGDPNLPSSAHSTSVELWPWLLTKWIQELQGGLEGTFPINVAEFIPKSILQSFLLALRLVQSSPYLVACVLAPCLNFIYLYLEDNYVMTAMFPVKRTDCEAHVTAAFLVELLN